MCSLDSIAYSDDLENATYNWVHPNSIFMSCWTNLLYYRIIYIPTLPLLGCEKALLVLILMLFQLIFMINIAIIIMCLTEYDSIVTLIIIGLTE